MTKCYTELSHLKTLSERFKYLKLGGNVGASTFGFDRYLNQRFYKSREWLNAKNKVIVRDNGGELGLIDLEISGLVIVHHIVPITMYDLQNFTKYLIDPEYLISSSLKMHNAIHYGDESVLQLSGNVERTPNDTKLW